tara:strand:- start:1241 stop:1798 length:558 start_codon:yes stop_codon:yes gene_type:complete
MSTITVDNFAITAKTQSLIVTAERAGKKADSTNAAAYDALYADGLRADMIYAGSRPRELILDLVLTNRFTAAERTLYNTAPKMIDSKAESAKRRKLTSRVTGRIGDYVRALKSREPEAKKATGSAEVTGSAKVTESTETVTPNEAMAEAIDKFLKNVTEQDGYFNLVSISKTGTAFYKELLKQPK